MLKLVRPLNRQEINHLDKCPRSSLIASDIRSAGLWNIRISWWFEMLE